jgi:glycosyltransferase involved in cell wall biosynthesis
VGVPAEAAPRYIPLTFIAQCPLAKVSIGLPFHNAARTLWAAIQSVFCQTFEEWELILVDDGSTDGSAEIAARTNDPRVRLVRDGKNLGLAYRLNQIAAMASAGCLARMDADDVMHPDRIRTQVEALERMPDISVLGSAAFVIDEANQVIGLRGGGSPDFRPDSVLRGCPLIHPTVIGRTGWFRCNPYDGRYIRAEDHELWCRVCVSSQFGRLPMPLLFYRDSPAIRKTLRSYKTQRMIFRTYGPGRVGVARAAAEVSKSYAKSAVITGAALLRLSGAVWRRRNWPLSDEARLSAEQLLAAVLQTRVPCQGR